MNTEKNAWACHSESCVAQRGGRIGGNVLDFIAWMERCSIRDAAVRLREWFALSAEQSLSAPASARHTPRSNRHQSRVKPTSHCHSNSAVWIKPIPIYRAAALPEILPGTSESAITVARA